MTRRAVQVSAVAQASSAATTTTISSLNDNHHSAELSSTLPLFSPLSSSSSSSSSAIACSAQGNVRRNNVRTSVLKNKKLVRTSPRFNPNFYAKFERMSSHESIVDSIITKSAFESKVHDDSFDYSHNKPNDQKKKLNGKKNPATVQAEVNRNSVYDESTDSSDIDELPSINNRNVIHETQDNNQTSPLKVQPNKARLNPIRRTSRKVHSNSVQTTNRPAHLRQNTNRKNYIDDIDLDELLDNECDDIIDDTNHSKSKRRKIVHTQPTKKRTSVSEKVAITNNKRIPKTDALNNNNNHSKNKRNNNNDNNKPKKIIKKAPKRIKATKNEPVRESRLPKRFAKDQGLLRRRFNNNDKEAQKKMDNLIGKTTRRRTVNAPTSPVNGSPTESSTSTSTTRTENSVPVRATHQEDDDIVDTTIVQNQTSPNKSNKQSSNLDQSLNEDLCQFCRTETDSNYLLGELRKLEDIIAHKYCLLFASGLVMKGEPHQGIDGFLPQDIRKELKRGRQLKCSYCPQRGAVVGCEVRQCKANYHLPCGIKNGAFNQFHSGDGSFPSTCINHREPIPIIKFDGVKLCTICQDSMECPMYDKNTKKNMNNELVHYKCCGAHFHRDCICQWAYHEGEYHLKCPNCNNEDDFKKATKSYGIHVPIKDREVSLYPTINESRPNDNDQSNSRSAGDSTRDQPNPQGDALVFTCEADNCKCKEGKTFNGSVGSVWELYACDRCGANSIHVACCVPPLQDGEREWFCALCSSV